MADPDPSTGQTLASIPEKLIRALPPAYILLIVLNCVFMAGLTYAVQHNADARNLLLNKIIDNCLLDRGPAK